MVGKRNGQAVNHILDPEAVSTPSALRQLPVSQRSSGQVSRDNSYLKKRDSDMLCVFVCFSIIIMTIFA